MAEEKLTQQKARDLGIREGATHFNAIIFIPRQKEAGYRGYDRGYDFPNLDDACKWALARFQELTQEGVNPRSIMVSAVKGEASALVRTYVPDRGWTVVRL